MERAIERRPAAALYYHSRGIILQRQGRLATASSAPPEFHGLASDMGASLLEELDVRGLPAEREHVIEELDGHPLGLRVFADASRGNS